MEHGRRTASCEDAGDYGLLHWGCDAGSDQSPECFTEVNWAAQSSDSVLALLSVRRNDGDASGSEVTGRQFSIFSAARVV